MHGLSFGFKMCLFVQLWSLPSSKLMGPSGDTQSTCASEGVVCGVCVRVCVRGENGVYGGWRGWLRRRAVPCGVRAHSGTCVSAFVLVRL